MSLLTISELSHTFGDKALYKNAAFAFYKGEHIGIVGGNGAGKSTLIRILTGEVIPDEGEIKWQPGLRLGHLDQYANIPEDSTIQAYLQEAFAPLYSMEEEMTRLYEEGALPGKEALLLRAAALQEALATQDFYSVDSRIRRVAAGLGLDAIGLERTIGTLSGGQRAKVILAKLLLEEPDVLLLDEPTNFLDKEHVAWLSSYLSAFSGAFLVVSHDFDFLEKTVTGICDIELGTIRKYHGTYSQFLKQKAHYRQDYIRQYQAQQKKIQETEAYIRKNIAGVNTRIAQGRRKQLERLDRLAPPSFVQKPSFRFRELDLSAQEVLAVHHLEIGYTYSLLPQLNFTVTCGQKLVITGFNGIGKSTLLKTLVGELPPRSGFFHFAPGVTVGYYSQDLVWENTAQTPLEFLSQAYPRMKNKELRQALARCGVKEEHVLRGIGTLSGGEQSKVKLCRILLSPCNFLILDEPTNHLDADTKEALQAALRDFRGCVLLVSHEEAFYHDWADRVFSIEKELR